MIATININLQPRILSKGLLRDANFSVLLQNLIESEFIMEAENYLNCPLILGH